MNPPPIHPTITQLYCTEAIKDFSSITRGITINLNFLEMETDGNSSFCPNVYMYIYIFFCSFVKVHDS